jgi:hypothetical protein
VKAMVVSANFPRVSIVLDDSDYRRI